MYLHSLSLPSVSSPPSRSPNYLRRDPLAGVDAKTASARLGHSTIAITLDLYTHAIRSLDDQAVERIAAALRRAPAG